MRKNGFEKRDRQEKRLRDSGVRRHRAAATRVVDLGGHAIMTVTSTPLRFLAKGTVVRARFPFAEGHDSKVRPAIVVAKYGQRVLLMPLTTSPRACCRTDIDLLDLGAAGLHKPTKARAARVATVDRHAVIEVLGHLSARDFTRIVIMSNVA